ncbi:MAG: hypothetical protein O7B98_14910 [Alphaproteobacteria bacterium]|nr:hypothetical protein [Alphaproteobacteria bacterium]
MDILEYWKPEIDWGPFQRGAVSDDMWLKFTELVQLCHAHRHWEEEVRVARSIPLPRPLHSESNYRRRKRARERKVDIIRREDHMYQAGFLAAEKISEMSYLISPENKGSPDSNLYFALRYAVAHQPSHERARFKAAAFNTFDASKELDSEPGEIARRWLSRAGYPDHISLGD